MNNQQALSTNKYICGIDEAGRGPLAGPVCAAAVILGNKFPCGLLNDSKKLSQPKREQLQKQIKDTALAYGIGWATHKEIDNINILQASLLAMKRAFLSMMKKINKMEGKAVQNNIQIISGNLSVIVDGNKTPVLPVPCTAMVKADAKIPEVMAASILAKTARDKFMDKMALFYPQYGYTQHKGYPTKAHKELVKIHGPSPIQRLSFQVR